MSTINDTTPQQEYQLFPKVADINEILSIFPSEISSEKDQNLITGYNELRHYISDILEVKIKQSKIYSCQYFLTPLREQLIQYYSVDKQLLSYYLSIYEKLLPIMPESERDIILINWMIRKFFIEKCKIKRSIRFKYLKFILEMKKTPAEEIAFLSKIENLNRVLKFLIFDLINEPEITKKIWIIRIKQIIMFQIKTKKLNIILFQYLFNLVCMILIYNYSILLFGKPPEKDNTLNSIGGDTLQEGINPLKIKEYTQHALELLNILMEQLQNKPPHMFHKYLLTVIIASRCLGDMNMLDDIIKTNCKFKTELTIELFDLIGITKELESTIQSFPEFFWSEDTITNNFFISKLSFEKEKDKYRKKIAEFLDKKLVISVDFLNSIDFQKSIMRTVVNIFIRDKSQYTLQKQFLVVSFWKALLKVDVSSLDQLFNTIMQPLFCWSGHFTYEWEVIFHFFESRRELFQKNPLYFSYIFQLVNMFKTNNYYGDVDLFEKHYLQWENIPNDFECQKLHIDFCFKTEHTMVEYLPLKIKQYETLKNSNETIKYLISKISSVYIKGNDKLNEVILKYFVPFYDNIRNKKELIEHWEDGIFNIFVKINDDNEVFLQEMFNYIRNRLNEKNYFPFDFIKRLIHYCCINPQFNKLKQVNLTFENFLDNIYNQIQKLNNNLVSEYITKILDIVSNLSYSINYEIIWGYINQSISILIWKLNYKNVYEQKEIDNFVIFHQQKLFAVLVSALINKKLDQNTNLILLKFIHKLCTQNLFFFINVNLGEFYSYLFQNVVSITLKTNKDEIKYILSLLTDFVYMFPNKHCYPSHIIPPYYFTTQDFPKKNLIQKKSIENLIILGISLLDNVKQQSPTKTETLILEKNELIDCGNLDGTILIKTIKTPTIETPNQLEHESIDFTWKLIVKILNSITFQLHSFFNFGTDNDKDKLKYMYNSFTLFKYLQTKQESKSRSMKEQEIKVLIDTLIQKLFVPLREILTKEKTIIVNLISFALYKLFYHNLELFTVFDDLLLQSIYYLTSFSWSSYLKDFTFKFTNSFPELRKFTSIKDKFLAEPHLYIRNQFNLLLYSFIELSPYCEKLSEIFMSILTKNINEVNKTLRNITILFLNTLEWHVAIKRKRDNYYKVNFYNSNEFYDTPNAENSFKVEGNKIVNITIDPNNQSNFDTLICSPFSNWKMHFKSLSYENKNEDNYRSFSILEKNINSKKIVDLDVSNNDNNENNEDYNNSQFLDDILAQATVKHEIGCKEKITMLFSNKGYQFQYLYTSEINQTLQPNDTRSSVVASTLSSEINGYPIHFYCSVNLFYSFVSTNNTSYTNNFLSFLSSFTGLKVNDIKSKLQKNSYLTIPTQNNQIYLTIYNSEESLNKFKQNNISNKNKFPTLDNIISLIWIENVNKIDIPLYVLENSKLFNIKIYTFSSHYFTIETKVNKKHSYYNSIIDNFTMSFEETYLFNSNETYKTVTNFLNKHIQLLCTLVIDKKLSSEVKSLSNQTFISSMLLPKEDNVYSRYKLINSI